MSERERLEAWAAEQDCPACGHHGLVIEWRLTAKPIGSFSLAGAQMNVSATERPWIRCPECGVEAEGK